MRVEVCLSVSLQRYLPSQNVLGRAQVKLKEGTTVKDLMKQWGIPQIRDHEGGTNLIMVNGNQGNIETHLHEGDRGPCLLPSSGRKHLTRPVTIARKQVTVSIKIK